jgi:acyl-CoA thioesterase I
MMSGEPARNKIRLSRKPALYWSAIFFWLVTTAGHAHASRIEIVALGESNTAGYGVGTNDAYPARLEAMLRAKGYDATVVNAGMSGDSSAMILNRVDGAVPTGTQVVLVQIGYYNDAIYGVSQAETAAHIKAVMARVRARGAKVVFVSSSDFAAIPRSDYQNDGIHLAPEGHTLFAARLLPRVIQAILGSR